MTPGIKRFMMYVTDENYKLLENEAKKRSLSVQKFVRDLVNDHLGIDSKIKLFQTDVMCPKCGSDGEIVVDFDGNRFCLNCGNTENIGVT